ncbi:hypothetical protein MD484_g7878, partial [Candolleomyces efflorescens]
MRTSPRKKPDAPNAGSKPKRQPARCRKCPDRPLKSECEHSRKGSKVVPQQLAMEVDAVPLSPASPSQACTVPGAPPGTPFAGSPMPSAVAGGYGLPQLDAFSSSVAPGGFHPPFQGGGYTFHPMYHSTFGAYANHGMISAPQHFPPPHTSSLPLDPVLAAATSPVSPNPPAVSATTAIVSNPPAVGATAAIVPSPVVDAPAVIAPSSVTNPPPSQAIQHHQEEEASLLTASNPSPGDVDFDNDDSEAEGTGTSRAPTAKATGTKKKTRVYASNRNPVHGFINGVGRGDRVLKMARRRALKPVYTDQTLASSSWRRLTRDFITRAEDISNRTASWLYVAAHNPSAGQPFTHFASCRLRIEASEDLQKIHQQVSSMMTVLKRVDRATSFQHEKEKEESLRKIQQIEGQLSAATEAAKLAQAEVEALKEQAAARDRLLRQHGWTPEVVTSQAQAAN